MFFRPGAGLMLIFCLGAAGMDFERYRVDNGWICMGAVLLTAERLILQFQGIADVPCFRDSLLSCLIPVLLLFPFFLFRMLGAGDIKVLAVAGILMRPNDMLLFLFGSFALAAVFSAVLMVIYGNFRERMRYFRGYIYKCLDSGVRRPYRLEGRRPENIHMTFPAALAVALWCAGI